MNPSSVFLMVTRRRVERRSRRTAREEELRKRTSIQGWRGKRGPPGGRGQGLVLGVKRADSCKIIIS